MKAMRTAVPSKYFGHGRKSRRSRLVRSPLARRGESANKLRLTQRSTVGSGQQCVKMVDRAATYSSLAHGAPLTCLGATTPLPRGNLSERILWEGCELHGHILGYQRLGCVFSHRRPETSEPGNLLLETDPAVGRREGAWRGEHLMTAIVSDRPQRYRPHKENRTRPSPISLIRC